MADLFLRIASQGLQAFLPAAFASAAYRERHAHATASSAIRFGVAVAGVLSIPAGWFFQHSDHQARWEAGLAVLAFVSIFWLIPVRRGIRGVAPWILAALTVLFVGRQAMEIGALLAVAMFQLHSVSAVLTIGAATLAAAGAAFAWCTIESRLDRSASRVATRIFFTLFAAQLAMYAFHESAEARLLPWSEALHSATEPYGPDGIYGRNFAWLLIVVPLGAVCIAWWRTRVRRDAALLRRGRYAAAASALLLTGIGAGLWFRPATAAPAGSPADGAAALTRASHVLFRMTGAGQDYNRLGVASLADPSGHRVSLGIPCERVAFGTERGLCLQAIRGAFTSDRAILFDRRFDVLASWTLAGSPSRTRIAPDGRLGAITVFVSGHAYASVFSTTTTIVDMSSGETIADLERFAILRDGVRMRPRDANVWGVTFTHDSNAFYATLGTAGKAFLVRGDLAHRTLTRTDEGLECPSLSPDERSIAFKKRAGPAPGAWRLAILDLSAMREHLVAGERRYIDDQVEWLDNARLLYGVPRGDSAVTDVWMASADGRTPPQLFIPAADSPAVVHLPDDVQ